MPPDALPRAATVPSTRARLLRGGTLTGIALMCLGVGMFPMSNASAKFLAAQYPLAEVLWARFAGHLLVALLVFLPRRGPRLLVARRPRLQLARSLLLLGSTVCFVSGLARLPLTTASAIGFTAPLVVLLLSAPLLGEPVRRAQWGAVAIGFLGALVVVRPQPALDPLGALFGFASASCYGLYQIVTRKGAAFDTAETGIVWAPLAGAAAMTVLMPFSAVWPHRAADWAIFAALGFFGALGHYFLNRAFQLAPAALLSPFGYFELIGATALGWIVFAGFPDALTWTGIALVIAGGIIAGRAARR